MKCLIAPFCIAIMTFETLLVQNVKMCMLPLKKENVETIKEILPEVTEATEEFNQSVEKASQVKETDTLDHSLFD